MKWSDLEFAPSDKKLRQFAALCLVVFSSLALWQWWGRHAPTAGTVWGALALLGPLGLIKPQLLRPVFVGWTIVAWPIGWLVSHLLLSLVYLGLFTPVSLLFKLTGRDTLALRRRNAATYWQPRPPTVDVRRYFRQY